LFQMINKFAALLLIGMASPYQILDWYGGRHTCHTASGALDVTGAITPFAACIRAYVIFSRAQIFNWPVVSQIRFSAMKTTPIPRMAAAQAAYQFIQSKRSVAVHE